MNIKAGDIVIVNSNVEDLPDLTEGRKYDVMDDNGVLIILDDAGDKREIISDEGELRHWYTMFEKPTTEETVDNMSDVCEKGDVVICTDENRWEREFTAGRLYIVYEDIDGLYIIDDEGDRRYRFTIDGSAISPHRKYYSGVTTEIISETPTDHTPEESGAMKNDITDEKLGYLYVHPVALYQLGLAKDAGSIKYAPWNFLKGHSASALMVAAKRHIDKYFFEGEDIDADTSERVGCPVHHLACAMACMEMMLAQIAEGTIKDDRPKSMVVPTTKEKMREIFGGDYGDKS